MSPKSDLGKESYGLVSASGSSWEPSVLQWIPVPEDEDKFRSALWEQLNVLYRSGLSHYPGSLFDPGEPGRFYFSTGFRVSSLGIQYASHLESAMPATVIYASLNYKSRQGWEFYFFMSEEVPGWNEALEPDFTAGLGFSYSRPTTFVGGPPLERHE